MITRRFVEEIIMAAGRAFKYASDSERKRDFYVEFIDSCRAIGVPFEILDARGRDWVYDDALLGNTVPERGIHAVR